MGRTGRDHVPLRGVEAIPLSRVGYAVSLPAGRLSIAVSLGAERFQGHVTALHSPYVVLFERDGAETLRLRRAALN